MRPERPGWELEGNTVHFALNPAIEVSGTLCGADINEDGAVDLVFLVSETTSYPLDLESGLGPRLIPRLGETLTLTGHLRDDRFGIEHLHVESELSGPESPAQEN